MWGARRAAGDGPALRTVVVLVPHHPGVGREPLGAPVAHVPQVVDDLPVTPHVVKARDFQAARVAFQRRPVPVRVRLV